MYLFYKLCPTAILGCLLICLNPPLPSEMHVLRQDHCICFQLFTLILTFLIQTYILIISYYLRVYQFGNFVIFLHFFLITYKANYSAFLNISIMDNINQLYTFKTFMLLLEPLLIISTTENSRCIHRC